MGDENRNRLKGYVMGAIAAATYGMNPLFALPLYADGLTANDVLLFRYGFAILILAVMIKARGRSFKIPPQSIIAILSLGLLMGASSWFLFESYNYMAAGIASTLLFVYPLMVAIIMAVVFRERLTLLTIVCIVMALGGIALLYKGDAGATLDPIGTLFVMLSALSYAIYLVWVNRNGLKAIPTVTLTFYVILFGSLIFICSAIGSGTVHTPTNPLMWGCAMALGILPTAVSLICTTIAIQNIGSTSTAILGALEPLTAVFFGIIIFGETLTGRDVAGLVLILVAVSVVIAADKVSVVLLRMRKLFPKRRWRDNA